MSYACIIAEKPSVASSIARVVGAKTPHRDGPCGYLEGNGYKVTWAFGHLICLKNPEESGFSKNELPIFPEEWQTKIVTKKGKDGKPATDPMAKKQLEVIDKAFAGSDRIIVATDAGREGELIFRYIYEYLGSRKPFKRLWISSLTDEAIRKGLDDIRDGSEYEHLSEAAHQRSQADWLVGFNASRALRLFTGIRANVSLGRVQTPTLGMICERFEENTHFVPSPYWQITAATAKDETPFSVRSAKDYATEAEAEHDLSITKETGTLTVTKAEKKRTATKPPLLYDITSLQRKANAKFGLTAKETLDTAQSLYLKKYLSYPRTGSRYIPEDVFKTIPSLITRHEGIPNLGAAAKALTGKKLCRKSVDDSKVTDHHALLPTGNIPDAGSLNKNEKNIFLLVVSRMLEAFGEDSLSDVTTIELDAGGVKYKAHGSTLVHAGWKSVTEEDSDPDSNEEKNDDRNETLPDLTEGDRLPIKKAEKTEKRTKPRPIFTDSSLLGEMETCGKSVDDEEAREAMKDVGIGTPATRAAVIDELISRQYITREKKKLIPTDLGLQVYSMVRGRRIADVRLTGEWERDLALVEQGKAESRKFEEGIKAFTMEIINDLRENCKPIENDRPAHGGPQGLTPMPCPCCGKEMKIGRYSLYCDEKNDGCGFRISYEIASKKLTKAQITAIARGEETEKIEGFRSKTGKTFEAALRCDKENKKVAFAFEEAPRIEGLICPLCGQELTDNGRTLACSCGFALWKKTCGKTLTETQIRTILSGRPVHLTGLKNPRKGTVFEADVILDKEKKGTSFDFSHNKRKPKSSRK